MHQPVTDPREIEWLAAELVEWIGGCLVEGHTAEALSTALSLVEELVSGQSPESAGFLKKHCRRRKGGRQFDS